MRLQGTPQYFEVEGYIKGGAIYTTQDAKGIVVGCTLTDVDSIDMCIQFLTDKIREFKKENER